MAKILIVEDDEDIGDILCSEMAKEGYEILRAYSGTEGRSLLGKDPDLILMDLMLPGMSGEELLTHITDNTPVIAISARSSIEDKTDLLERGCTDYITKPFDIREVKARAAVALRNSSKKDRKGRLSVSGIDMDTDSHTVSIDGSPLHLTRTEYAILKYLMTNSGRVISKAELLELISKDTPDCTDESTLKVHVSNLRKKIKTALGSDPIEAVWGIGFKFN
ncbi:MAG: response regulator transcription factor [Clostridiales bacterium]|nr:response regulator transcription factor [Clostridiales bacterium]